VPAPFHEVQFPPDIALGATGGPERRTDIVTLRSGDEERNSVWANSRRKYDASYGVKTFAQLEIVAAFFEERRGRLTGFRWKDHFDYRSCSSPNTPSPTNQVIGTGNGVLATFQLTKKYGSLYAPWVRSIRKPVAGTVRVAVAGTEKVLGTHFTVDTATGIVTFTAGNIPPNGASVTAGFQFDVPVRFDTDYLEIDRALMQGGYIRSIPIIEIRV
jgi:uncharacterized protein (TIGR02217 family)